MKRFLMLMLALLMVTGAGIAEETPAIVVTSFPCYDFMRAVIGDDANIRMLIRPGTEVHSYEPTPKDILEIADADLFVYIGGESDVWVDNLMKTFDENGPKTLKLMDSVSLLEEEDDHGHLEHQGGSGDRDVPRLGDREHLVTRGDAVFFLVDEDDDLCEVVESGVDRLEHLLPRDAVRQGERRTDPAVVDVLAFQVHGTAPLVLSVSATRVGVGRQAVVDDASAPSEGLAVGTCIMISMESMSWHIDLLYFS